MGVAMDSDANRSHESRAAIIQVVRDPISFLALVILIADGLGLAAFIGGAAPSMVLAMCGTISLVLAGIVVFLAYKRPEALRGVRHEQPIDSKSLTAPLEAQIATFQEEIGRLRAANAALRVNIEKYESLKMRVIGLLGSSSRGIDSLYKHIYGAFGETLVEKNQLLGAVGALVDEGKIERDPRLTDSYTVRHR
jgi:hypothetical protein